MKSTLLLLLPQWLLSLFLSMTVSSLALGSDAFQEDDKKNENDDNPNDITEDPVQDLFDWINTTDGSSYSMMGGFVHPSQEYRLLEDGFYGMVATAPISKGALLAKIPWSQIFTSAPSQKPFTGEGIMPCDMVEALAEQMASPETSKYEPFLKFLKMASQRPPINQMPSAWSKEGKQLIHAIVGGPSPFETNIAPTEPAEWLDVDWYGNCQGTADGETAALWTVSWSDEGIMVPLVTGMYLHRNGIWTNADVTTKKFRHVQVHATRHIAKDEVLYISQNFCQECGSRHKGYGTAEIFRDYGLIEDYPQQWKFADVARFTIDQNLQTGNLTFQWNKGVNYKEKQGYWEDILDLRKQYRRLLKVKNVQYGQGNPGIPQHEWDLAWKFQRANLIALSMAMDVLEAGTVPFKTSKKRPVPREWNLSDFVLEGPHYRSLQWEWDDLNYHDETCDNGEIMEFHQHQYVEKIKTPYQNMKFSIQPETGDVVLELDNVVQIASIYRPQYHEYSVHAAARFLDSVQRVIFIGGGDSMLLHEILKYPELEFVVGLELDQMVVRKSFQYFQTQPHFDDPRVEWWFGDATKSLLLLTKEYWQSFDLVLVDLSETVMSLSVTKELDVFDALALLLKPEGILVKNEQYLHAVSKVFDHSIHIVYECPIICDQVLSMGSNKADFLHTPLKDHGVPTLLYEPLVTEENRLDYLHDYRKNNARVQGKCDAPLDCTIPDEEQSKSAGIMEIIDAEQVAISLDGSLVQVMETILSQQGLQLMTSPVVQGNIILIVMREGYIVARMWPMEKYCSMDINLWGKFDRLKPLTAAIRNALQSPLVSNFRVVVGGMFGSSTWTEDRTAIGPQMAQVRDCEEMEFSNEVPDGVDLPSSNEIIRAATEESLEKVIPFTEVWATVICGPKNEDCMAVDQLHKSDKVANIFRLSTCPDLSSNETMYACENTLMLEWRQMLDAKHPSNMLVVDESAPFAMLQIVNSILTEQRMFDLALARVNVALAWSSRPSDEPWRRQFLEFYRRQYRDDPLSRGEIMIHSGTQEVEVGVVSCGFDRTAHSILDLERALRARYPPQEKAIDISVNTIYGGKYPWIEPFEPKEFLHSDYDNKPGLEQYYNQNPLAHHVVFQLEPRDGDPDFEFSADSLSILFDQSLRQSNFECTDKEVYRGFGDGCLVSCLNPSTGTVLMTWDGRTHIDVSYYNIGSDDKASGFADFSRAFMLYTKAKIQVTLQDQMPRGTRRTINPASDLRTPQQVKDFME